MNKNVKEIFSSRVVDSFDGFNFEFDIYVDNESGTWWYAFMDVLTAIDFSRRAGEKYYYKINECDKCNFYDKGFINEFGENRPSERSFISYNALMNLLDRNFKRMNAFAKIVNKLYGRKEIKSSNDRIEETVCNLYQCYNTGDLEGIFIEADKLVNSEIGLDMLSKLGIKDIEKEEIIYKFRDELYVCDEIEEVEWNIRMKKKDNPNEEEERRSLYRKHKGQGTTCPSWIKDVIK